MINNINTNFLEGLKANTGAHHEEKVLIFTKPFEEYLTVQSVRCDTW
jgi:hypothetical protein